MSTKIALLLLLGFVMGGFAEECCGDNELKVREEDSSWGKYPLDLEWTPDTRIPMTRDFDMARKEETRGKFKVKKKFKRFLLPLLLAYKLKFFTLVPVLIGGLILLTGATGLAGFFFALFAAVMGLKAGNH